MPLSAILLYLLSDGFLAGGHVTSLAPIRVEQVGLKWSFQKSGICESLLRFVPSACLLLRLTAGARLSNCGCLDAAMEHVVDPWLVPQLLQDWQTRGARLARG
jgi:hypothetical protein